MDCCLVAEELVPECSVEVGRLDCALLVGWCFAAEVPVPGSSVVDVSRLVLALLVG